MAKATIRRSWGDDGDALAICVEVDESFPDAVAEARTNARQAYADAMGITLAAEVDES